MTLTRGFLAVAGAMLVGAAVGAGIGWMVGTLSPDVYRQWVAFGDSPDFSPVDFGVALGFLQGAGAGIVVGLVLVAIVAWHDVAVRRRGEE